MFQIFQFVNSSTVSAAARAHSPSEARTDIFLYESIRSIRTQTFAPPKADAKRERLSAQFKSAEAYRFCSSTDFPRRTFSSQANSMSSVNFFRNSHARGLNQCTAAQRARAKGCRRFLCASVHVQAQRRCPAPHNSRAGLFSGGICRKRRLS